jgi:D-alanyl-lipoteichoic acid acyltransferase DltB (MBOAT superfamily)
MNHRYIYIPVGGSKRVVLATTLVFTFVALWHDLSFKLLAWGWLVSLFILPELVARKAIPAEKVRRFLRSVFGSNG